LVSVRIVMGWMKHMEYMEHKIECGVCGIVLPSDANRAITTCKHAFCISCLLKWYRVNPTCPMCRRLLHDEDDEEDEEDKEDADPAQARAEEEHIRQLIIQTDRIFEELEFNMEDIALIKNHLLLPVILLFLLPHDY